MSCSRSGDGFRNPCLTMHQPWASLLVHGIKRVEGRSWPAPLTGRLWIHAAGKAPDPATIKAMEDFYREIYAANGITNIKFPEHYPVSRLLGCVEVVGCIKSEELVCWEEVPESVRLEGLTDFCWLCEQPQKLVVPFEMRGYQRVYNLERRIFEAAVRGLCPVKGPLPVKFPLPDPQNRFSLKPGSQASCHALSKPSTLDRSPSLNAAIAGAQSAAMQYTKQDHNKFSKENLTHVNDAVCFGEQNNSKKLVMEDTRRLSVVSNTRHDSSDQLNTQCNDCQEHSNRSGQNPQLRLFAAAMKELSQI